MSIEAAIVEWARTRAAWQKTALRRLAAGEQIAETDFVAIADALCAGDQQPDDELKPEHISTSSAEAASVALLNVAELIGVNALVPGEKLSFGAAGLTVVYGDNGCGKSGYARILKSMVSSRHRDQVLSNVFREVAPLSASVTFSAAGGTQTQVAWPGGHSDLTRVRFFDDACRESYVTKDAETTYRPAALHLLEGLIRVCDGVKAVLDKKSGDLQKITDDLPRLKEGTPAASFMAKLSHKTTEEQLASACAVRTDVEAELSRLRSEEARLLATDPDKERARLEKLASDLSALANHLETCRRDLSDDVYQKLRELRENVATKTDAATTAAKQFEGEPVGGVGSPAWRALWDSAQQFVAAQTQAQHPPCEIDGRCALCQEPLPESAKARIARFETFVANALQKQLSDANSALKTAIRVLDGFEVFPSRILTLFERISGHELAQPCKEELSALEARRDAMRQQQQPDLLTSESLTTRTRDAGRAALEAAAAVPKEGFGNQIATLRSEREALEAQQALSGKKASILREVGRLRKLDRIARTQSEASTTAISRKAAELTRAHVTDVMRDRFTRETDRLRLERVTLKDIGGQKGTLRHQPSFLGAVQKASLPQVLSEGEQTALGLAGFFTEVALDSSKSAIVLDDPVSSLDHVRRGNVAARLCEFAEEQQVIVFTHDLSFVADLFAHAGRVGVDITERSIERRGTKEPGVCREKHPWKAKDTKERLADLERDLQKMKGEESAWDQTTREREISDWAGRLSETWERLVNHEVAGQLVDRGSQEVKPRMFRVFAKVTEQDDHEFQCSYANVSRWARRHDKSVDVNYVPPSLGEMAKELALVKAWFGRIKNYRN